MCSQLHSSLAEKEKQLEAKTTEILSLQVHAQDVEE